MLHGDALRSSAHRRCSRAAPRARGAAPRSRDDGVDDAGPPRRPRPARSRASASSADRAGLSKSSTRTYHGYGRGKGSRLPGMFRKTRSRHARDELEAGDALAAAARAASRAAPRRRRRIGTATNAVATARRPGRSFSTARGDDAERALGADEEVLQVVAGVVLAQPAQPVPDAAVGQHDLEPEHLLAHVAVAQHLRAAGVGGDVAAHLAAALGGERQRKEPVVLRGHALQVGEDAAGLDGDGVVVEVDVAHAVHPRDVQHDLRAGARRARSRRTGSCCRACGTIGVPVLAAGRHDRGDLGRRARPDHRERPADVHAGPVDLPNAATSSRRASTCSVPTTCRSRSSRSFTVPPRVCAHTLPPAMVFDARVPLVVPSLNP